MDRSRAILIIDDNEDDRCLFRRALSHNPEGLPEFTEAGSGISGLESLASHRPDCVLLDYSLPGQNGIDVLKRIRALYPFLPVVMLTGHGNELVAVQSMKDGAQDYIVKSDITSETLERVVRTSIAHCQLEKRVDEQRAALELFSHALAHDLKEPVRTIRSFVELMAIDQGSPEKMETYYQFVANAATRMAMIIDTVFLYTKLDGPRSNKSPHCNMSDVLGAVGDNLALLFREHHVTVITDTMPDVVAHPAQMIQLLQNLFVNAVRHCPSPVTIHLGVVAEGGDWLFSVADNGPGIEAEYLENIFTPFRRLNSNEDGAGMGLAICRKIVELSGGRMWCESQVGKGATFFFRLPARKADAAATASLSPNDLPTPGEAAPRQLATLLVVDDRKADVELTRILLSDVANLKCHMLVAFDGKQALGAMREAIATGTPIDLMLLDINMPVMSGFELLGRMAQEPSLLHTRVVMCSGSSDDRDMDRARDMGAMGYLLKPPRLDNLIPLLHKAPHIELEKTSGGYSLYKAI